MKVLEWFSQWPSFLSVLQEYNPLGTGALSLGTKQLGHEANHSPPSNANVNVWDYTSTPP